MVFVKVRSDKTPFHYILLEHIVRIEEKQNGTWKVFFLDGNFINLEIDETNIFLMSINISQKAEEASAF